MAELKNEIGNTYGYLTVLQRAGTKDRYATWLCQCQCGNTIEVKGINLRRGGPGAGTRSCGCLQHQKVQEINKDKLIDLTGQKFGKLTVLSRGKNRGIQPTWICKCECGSVNEVIGSNLRKDNGTFSCGCLHSRGEFVIAQILSDNHIDFQREVKFLDCLSNDGYQLRYDFGVFDKSRLQYLIEYHGSQHYEENAFMGRDDFVARKERDKIKREYCEKNNIPLIIIPYTHFNQLKINDLLLGETTFLYKGDKENETISGN